MDAPTTSFPAEDDKEFLALLSLLRSHGVEVALSTSEDAKKVVRTATVSWRTHNAAARSIESRWA